MKALFLFLFGFWSFLLTAQTQIAVKVRLYKNMPQAKIAIQQNNNPVIMLEQNIPKDLLLKTDDHLSFFVNENLIETIEISPKIIERKSLSVLLTESTVLDEVEIEYTNLNNKLGLGSEKYTRAEREVKRDNQLTYNDPYSSVRGLKLDGLVNKLSGRAKSNKKALSLEREVQAMERFLSVYSADYLYENYKLPKEKASYFALRMMDFMTPETDLKSDNFRMLMEEQLLNFNYD